MNPPENNKMGEEVDVSGCIPDLGIYDKKDAFVILLNMTNRTD